MKIVFDGKIETCKDGSALRQYDGSIEFSSQTGFDNIYIKIDKDTTFIVNKKEFMLMFASLKELS